MAARTKRNTRSRSTKSGGRKKGSSRRYGKKASEKVERAMHEMKAGTLRSGRSRKKVKSRKQAIAIGLSQARKEGGKVPSAPKSRSRRNSSTGRKKSSRSSAKRGTRRTSRKSSQSSRTGSKSARRSH